VAAQDRRDAERPKRWGYVLAIALSAAAHVAIVWFALFVLPGLFRSEIEPPPAYTVKIVDQIPAGDLGTRLPAIDNEPQARQEQQPAEEEQPKPSEEKPPPPKPPAPAEDEKNAIALNSAVTPTPTPIPTPVATLAPTPAATPEAMSAATPRPRRNPRPKPTPRSTPRPTPHALRRATPKPTPQTVKKPRPRSSPVMVAKSAATPSVSERLKQIHDELIKGEKNAKQSANRGSGPVVANTVSNGVGYGVGPGKGSAGLEEDTEFLLYYKDVQGKIKDAWSFSGGDPKLTATVTFGINPDGTLNGLRIVSSSRDPAFDDSVVRAIKRAAPFLPPPEKYRSQFAGGVEAQFKLGELNS